MLVFIVKETSQSIWSMAANEKEVLYNSVSALAIKVNYSVYFDNLHQELMFWESCGSLRLLCNTKTGFKLLLGQK